MLITRETQATKGIQPWNTDQTPKIGVAYVKKSIGVPMELNPHKVKPHKQRDTEYKRTDGHLIEEPIREPP